ncbi:sigma-E factor negative regulatory protein [Caldimonas brevitalea]|uniref:Sigma-E factor negative regulatory protein RseA n=1 Tax=Caldimonas brevitalea TaxID=413882 RepID=A0A0G3BP25_9BURK|nr:sigma-E factor negative regulatory protein [Caldimonas brevitalea]AKJ31162.1 sigma-E factor negative regulatory protein RseA [Caldimonas brevitalea]
MLTDGMRVSGLSAEARERLSALSDGEAGAEELHSTLSGWREDAAVRAGTCETWHVYHLIGDVMRSDDLCGHGEDDKFLARLRERLAQEAVVMAPAPSTARVDAPDATVQVANGAPIAVRRRSWVAPMAAAAGVMAVAGVLVVTRVSTPGGALTGAPQMVQAGAPGVVAAPLQTVAASTPAQPETEIAVGHGLLRDPRLDQYLSAHKQFGGSSALGVPSGFLRSATYEGQNR